MYLLMVVTAKYVIDQLGASTVVAAWAGSVFIVGGLVARPVCGGVIDRVGHKKMLAAGVAATLLVIVFYPIAASVSSLLLVRFLHGVSSGITTTAAATIAAGIIPHEKRGEGIGYYSLGQTLATATGPFLGVFLSQHGSYGGVFTAVLLAAAAGVVLVPFLSVSPAALAVGTAETGRVPRIGRLVERSVIPISLVSMTMSLCYSSVVAFLAVYSAEIELVRAGGLFFVVYSATVFLARPFAGRKLDALGDNPVMYPALVAVAISFGLLSQATSSLALLVSAALLGCGSGVIRSCGQAIALKVAPTHRMGPATATFLTMLDVGMTTGPLLAGALIPALGYRGMYAAAAIVASGNVFLYYALHGTRAASRAG